MRLRVRLQPQYAALEFRHAPPGVKKRIKAVLRCLIVDPMGRDERVDVRRLKTSGDRVYFRARIGDWRFVYTFDAEVLYVIRVFHRSEGYEWMDRLDERRDGGLP